MPQGRPRAFARKIGQQYQARVYTPTTAEGWKGMVALAAKPYVPFPPMTGPLYLSLIFFLPRPKGHFNSKGQLKPAAPDWHTSRGDFDNYAKAVCDALTQIGMWHDDAQISAALIEKRYGDPCGCNIVIRSLEQTAPPDGCREARPTQPTHESSGLCPTQDGPPLPGLKLTC